MKGERFGLEKQGYFGPVYQDNRYGFSVGGPIEANADYLSKESLGGSSYPPGQTADGLIYLREPPAWPITAEVRHHVFLAFKEALNNAVRHGGATEVSFKVRLSDDRMQILIVDNGRGFDLSARSTRVEDDELVAETVHLAKGNGGHWGCP